jgi:legumain
MGKHFLVSDFQAEAKTFEFSPTRNASKPFPRLDRVKTEDVRISILQKKLAKAASQVERNALRASLSQVLKEKRQVSVTMTRIAAKAAKSGLGVSLETVLSERLDLTNHECYAPAVDKLIEKCFNMNKEFALRNLFVLVNLCESGVEKEKIFDAIESTCKTRF